MQRQSGDVTAISTPLQESLLSGRTVLFRILAAMIPLEYVRVNQYTHITKHKTLSSLIIQLIITCHCIFPQTTMEKTTVTTTMIRTVKTTSDMTVTTTATIRMGVTTRKSNNKEESNNKIEDDIQKVARNYKTINSNENSRKLIKIQ